MPRAVDPDRAGAGRVGLDAVGLAAMTTDSSPRAPLADRVLSERVQSVPPSGIRRFFDIAATMDDVISLGVGEPDFDTPRVIVEAGVESLREGRTHYTSNFGTLELRRALVAPPRARGTASTTTRPPRCWSRSGRRRRSTWRCARRATRATRSSSTSRRTWRTSRRIVFAGGVVRHVATRFEDDFALDPAAVEAAITPRTKALFLGYPCNPTGPSCRDDVQDALADIAVRHDLLVYSDEIYDRLVYGTYRHRAMSALPGHARADDPDGWLLEGVRHDRLAGRLRRGAGRDPRGHRSRSTSTGSCPPRRRPRTPRSRRSSRASRTSSGCVAEYDRRRRLIVDGLNAIGLETFEPRGAFYAFPRIGSTGLTNDEFTERLLDEEHVAVVPGQRVRAVGRRPRPDVLRHLLRAARGGPRRIGRFVERVRPA